MARQPGSYLFRGGAYAFAARFTDPALVIETQAGALLGASGGASSASAPAFSRTVDDRPISFSGAESSVTGTQKDGQRSMRARVTVNAVNFLNVVTADSIVAEVVSEHSASSEPYRMNQAHVWFGESNFANLKIAGQPIGLKLNTRMFAEHPTYEDFEGIQQRRGKRYAWKPKNVRGLIVTSLLQEPLRFAGEGITVDGHIIKIANFGRIHVAEVIIERGYRRLHMLRFELGSPVVGDAVFGGGDGNGTDILP